MATSSAVIAGDDILASDYNDLRTDVLATHDHEGTDGQKLEFNSCFDTAITATEAEINQLIAGIAATSTQATLDALMDKTVNITSHGHDRPIRDVVQLMTSGTALARYGAGGPMGASMNDSADTIVETVRSLYRPVGYNISSMKFYFIGAANLSANLRLDFNGGSWKDDNSIANDVVGATTYAVTVGAIGEVEVVDIPSSAYASWDTGEYFHLTIQRTATHIDDTYNANVFAVLLEVIYTLP